MDIIKRHHFIRGKEDVLSTDKLRELISMYLNTPNLNFLIGAGCSYGTSKSPGIPTMQVLKDQFWKKYDEEIRQLAPSLNYEELTKLNLEQLIEFFQAKKLIADRLNSASTGDVIAEVINKIQAFIVREIMSGMKNEDVLDTYKAFYRSLENSTRKAPINVFTTNYDLYNEKALDEIGYLYNDGFIGTCRRVFNPLVYNYTLVDNMDLSSGIWQRIPNFTNLYKIHGSISWCHDSNRDEVVMRNPMDQDADFSDPVLIYPTPMKDRSTLMTPYTDLMRCMQNALLKDNATLIVFGYSFNDEHINRIILNALAVPSFHLIVFNDSKKTMELTKLNSQRIIICYSDSSVDVDQSEDRKTDIPIHYFQSAVNEFFIRRDKEEEIETLKQKVRDFFVTSENGNEKN